MHGIMCQLPVALVPDGSLELNCCTAIQALGQLPCVNPSHTVVAYTPVCSTAEWSVIVSSERFVYGCHIDCHVNGDWFGSHHYGST